MTNYIARSYILSVTAGANSLILFKEMHSVVPNRHVVSVRV